jgi:ELWxxDGT repeat protein
LFAVAAAGDRLFLAASDGSAGIEPWTSDGTAAGTFALADMAPGVASSSPDFVRVAGGQVWFRARRAGTIELCALPLGRLGAAAVETLGAGCGGRHGVPRLTTNELPRVGSTTFALELTSAPAFAPVLFTLAGEPGLLALGACRLRSLVGLGTALRTAGFDGRAALPMPLPNVPALAGTTWVAQAIVLDALGTAPGVSLSPALGGVVGAP